ncbi:MAG: Cytoplasmic and mitochondrial histidine tRNA synthetase [Bogoriella megaspora]|nr:MAG: Cytoplasmic and mitochondrial histidine tRNA synthetase [Bogoriella megaspora]
MPSKGKQTAIAKTPKGTRDWSFADQAIRNKIYSIIKSTFERVGACELDTPAFETREILAGKYGEDSKLIYDLADQGGELCSLRYDLTVPFARWLAMNGGVTKVKRYHLAKVWRRDQPAMTKGRQREFYQCDLDIAGQFGPMIPDAEILQVVVMVFEALGWKGNYTIKINNRLILDGIFQVCGVPAEKTRTISSAVDKLDKSPWEEVKKEMTEEKGLDPAVADKISTYVLRKGGLELLNALLSDEALVANASAKRGLDDMALLFKYLSAFNIMDKISFDMSLARGLDYYTGVIYEVITEGSAPPGKDGSSKRKLEGEEAVGVGSIAGGGRYDELVGKFSGKPMPCVGVSFGIDRIFSLIKTRLADTSAGPDPVFGKINPRGSETDVFVMAMGGNPLLLERMTAATKLRSAGIKTEYTLKDKVKVVAQFKDAEDSGAPIAIMLGEEELKQGKVKIKEMGLPEGHPEKDGVLVSADDIAKEVKVKLDAIKAANSELANGMRELTVE